ncbi:DUF1761 domain-containing protein [Pseudoalteromonas phenolica]|uniref:DUF1761 domain-containing protein n=2 Tax=Pseudoalteromonas TaxID=53246 RepID=A0A4Q7IKP8_9GAMM|nr:DUF1761 domain-containing protein [Pseudoalteromonas phenolica]RZQ52450.1 DUF1761 domain-containing protein [Pseudoalteromonas phenolica]TMN86869.1 DUF1761 domain-containing protein [Pseudoalteromonas phenolica]TMP82555.1 DUF1761 domain-containing protein [Pseudoalteromonas phenolica]
MQLAELNYWAILLAALSSFMLGGLWYSPVLFGKTWLEGCGLTELDLQNSDPKLIYGLAFILSLLAAFVLALILGPDPNITQSITIGAAVGIGLASSSLGISYIFEQRPLSLFLVNGGYHTFQFILMAVILSVTG